MKLRSKVAIITLVAVSTIIFVKPIRTAVFEYNPITVAIKYKQYKLGMECAKKVEKTMNERYEIDFVVEEPQIFSNEGFGENLYTFAVYPKKQPDLRFPVTWDIGLDQLDRDYYISARMNNEIDDIWNPILKRVYGDDFLVYEMSAGMYASLIDEKYKELSTMTVEEMLNKYPDKFIFELKGFVFIDEFSEEFEAERILECAKWFNGKQIGICHWGQWLVRKGDKKVILNGIADKDPRDLDTLYEQGIVFEAFAINESHKYKDKQSILSSLYYKKNDN
jgi:hypothetical protein